MKQAIVAGNITRDAVQRRTQGGDPVTSFSVAVNDQRTKEPVFFDCSLWGVRGDKVAPYLKKGTKVTVCGDLGRREHEGKTYLTINVSELTLMGGGERRDTMTAHNGETYDRADVMAHVRDSYGNTGAALDDDLPF